MLIETFSQRVVDLYLLGFVITVNLLAAWFHSNFPQHLWNLLHRGLNPVYTKDDLTNAAIETYRNLGDLWVCPLCLGTWFSMFVSLIVATLGGLDGRQAFYFVTAATLSWPAGYYLLHKHLSR